MPEILLALGQSERSSAGPLIRRWSGGIALTAAVGAAYYLVAYVTILGLLLQPERVSVFWPAAGISSGVLIALGPRARWSVAAGVMVAEVVASSKGRSLWVATGFALCDAAEPLIIAGLIVRYFGASFALDRLRNVLGLLAATLAGCGISSFGAAVVTRLDVGPSVSILPTGLHWFAGVADGVVTVAPLVIGLAAAIREPPPRSELIEGTAALLALAAMAGIIVSLPSQSWQTVMPVALLFPLLLWLAARCRPVFAAAGAFTVSLAVASTTIFGVGHFGDTRLPIDDRILQAQAVILVASIGAYVLAALFAERRESEGRLARANRVLQRERDNKLMNIEAIVASIAHEVKQPLAAISMNGGAALLFLNEARPDFDEIRAALNAVVSDGHRASEVFDSMRSLFRNVDHGRQPIDMNELILEVWQSLRGELRDHAVTARPELTSEMPLVDGNRRQLQQVIFNLLHNALEAMEGTTDRPRVLQVRTERGGPDAIAVTVQDSGMGIDPKRLDDIFDAFVTTKAEGMGLGLAICRMIIERHGGQLTVSSDGRSGALFHVVLPIGPSHNSVAGKDAAQAVASYR